MPPQSTTSHDHHAKRDAAFFDRVLRTRVIIRPAADRFLDGNSGHVLRRHCEAAALVADAHAYPGNITGYRASTKTCVALGVSKDRARALRGAALNMAVGLNVFSSLEAHERLPLYHAELKQLLGNATPAAAIAHVASDELGFPAVFRVYQAADVSVVQAIEHVRRRIQELRVHPTLGAWLEGGEYGIAILAPTCKRRDALQTALTKSSLTSQASILLGLGPTVETLHATLTELRRMEA